MRAAADACTLVLAGGRATRLPGKLAEHVAGEAMLSAVVRRFQTCGKVVVAGHPPRGVELLEALVIPDRHPGAGPLQAVHDALLVLRERLCVVVAGDMPQAGAELFDRLMSAYRAGDEAVVPLNGGRLEPLTSLYDRTAFVRASGLALQHGRRSMHAALELLHVRRITAPAEWFVNVNTADELRLAQIHGGAPSR